MEHRTARAAAFARMLRFRNAPLIRADLGAVGGGRGASRG